MVTDFKIARIPVIQFGCGKFSMLPEIIKQYEGKVLMVLSKSLAAGSMQIKKMESDLKKAKISFEIAYVHGEPTVSTIDEISGLYRHSKIKAICGIGGGSVIDTAKAVSAMLTEQGTVEHYLEGVGTKSVTGERIPLIAIPSTAGTGAEATKNAVISKTGPAGFKRSLRHDNYIPEIALIDPELCFSCPPEITASSGMDAFTQLMESYLSTNANPFTDALALKGLAAIREALLPAFIDGLNLNARSAMSFAALLSGITLANAGLGVVHGFASSIGGYFNIPHGAICGTLLAAVNKANIAEISLLDKSVQQEKMLVLASLFIPEPGLSEIDRLKKFADFIFDLTEKLKLPRLGEYGVTEADVESIVKITDQKFNPIRLSDQVLREILSARI